MAKTYSFKVAVQADCKSLVESTGTEYTAALNNAIAAEYRLIGNAEKAVATVLSATNKVAPSQSSMALVLAPTTAIVATTPSAASVPTQAATVVPAATKATKATKQAKAPREPRPTNSQVLRAEAVLAGWTVTDLPLGSVEKHNPHRGTQNVAFRCEMGDTTIDIATLVNWRGNEVPDAFYVYKANAKPRTVGYAYEMIDVLRNGAADGSGAKSSLYMRADTRAALAPIVAGLLQAPFVAVAPAVEPQALVSA